MTNYYEALGLNPDVETEVIQTAIDNRYNEWRQLATHPDPAIVEEANRNLRLLEQARMTLTDPSRRAAYDAGIGLGGGGLADPSAILQKAAPPPPQPRKGAATQGSEAGPGSGLWACPKCATDNPPQTKHCFKCGAQLVRMCPNCNLMTSLVATGFCGNCGAQYEVALRLAELRRLQSTATNEYNQANGELEQARKNLKSLEEPKFPVFSAVGIGLVGLLSIFYSLANSFEAFCTGIGLLILLGGVGLIISQYNKRKSEMAKKVSELHSIEADAQQRLNAANNELAEYEVEIAELEKKLRAKA